MPTISITYKGELRCESIHTRSGNMLITDAPVDNNGKGEAYSPTDTLASALGTCMMTIMGIKSRDMNIDIKGSTIEVIKIMEENPRRVGEVKVDLLICFNEMDEKQKKILESTAINCPVAKSLHPDLIQSVRFSYAKKNPA